MCLDRHPLPLAICLCPLSCRKMNLGSILKSFPISKMFSSCWINPSHSMMVPPSCFKVGGVFSRWCAMLVFCHIANQPHNSHFHFIWPQQFPPHISCVLQMAFGELFIGIPIKLFQQLVSFLPFFIEGQKKICKVHGCPDYTFFHFGCGLQQLLHSIKYRFLTLPCFKWICAWTFHCVPWSSWWMIGYLFIFTYCSWFYLCLKSR